MPKSDMHPDCWTNKEVHIFMAKKGTKFKRYSPKFKLSVIMDMRENHLGYRETIKKHKIGSKNNRGNGGGIDMLKRWEKIYDEEGYEGLAKERRGLAKKMDGAWKGKPPKEQPEIKDDLVAENERLKKRLEYLEAENEYLKKLQALIQQKEAQKTERKKK